MQGSISSISSSHSSISTRSSSISNHSSINKKLIFFVFSFFLIVNIISTGGHFDMWDGPATYLVTESMALKHSAKLYPDIPNITKSSSLALEHAMIYLEVLNYETITGKYNQWASKSWPLEPVYTSRGLLLAAIAVPFYYTANILSVDPKAFVGVFVNSLIITLTSLIVFCFSLELYASRKIAFILSLIFTVCSFILPYNTSFFPQPLQTLCIIAAAFFIYKSLHCHFSYICQYYSNNNNNNKGIYFAGLGGLFLGLSISAHPTSAIVIPGFVVYSIFYMRRSRKNLCSFLVVLGVALSFMGLVNYVRFGSFTEFGYGYFGSLAAHTGWKGLIGLLVSPGAGLLFYFPPIVLLPIALKYMYRKNRGLFFLITYVTIVSWLYFGTYQEIAGQSRFWTGAVAWGPRYLILILPFITISFGTLLTHLRNNNKRKLLLKYSIITLCVAGFTINLLGTLVWPVYADLMYAYDHEKLGAYSLYVSGITSEAVTWNPYYSPIVLDIKMLMDNYISHIVPEKYANSYWQYMTFGLAPCSYDTYVFCKFGIIPVLGLGIIDMILSVLIINEIEYNNILHLPQLFAKNYCAKVKVRKENY